MKKFSILFRGFSIFSILLLFVFNPLSNVSSEGPNIDLNCVRKLTIEGRADEIEEVCETEDIRYVYTEAPYSECETNALGSGACDIDTEKCLRNYDTQTETIVSFQCSQYVVDKTLCGPQCDPSNPNTQCEVANLLAFSTQVRNGGTPSLEYQCRDVNELQIFGVNMGPVDQAVAKIIRTTLTVIFVVTAVFMGFRILWVLWQISQRDQESFENAQKTLLNALIGLFLMISGIVVVQLLASQFGISGNIFEFTFNPSQ
jgi:hypothetical protein